MLGYDQSDDVYWIPLVQNFLGFEEALTIEPLRYHGDAGIIILMPK
jgi:hypothetical protein